MRRNLFYLVMLFAFAACNNDVELTDSQSPADLSVNADFLKLDSTDVAGVLKIYANVPEVNVQWNVTSDIDCNLDTSQKTIKLLNGEGELPIKWAGLLKDNSYGPLGTAFTALVTLSVGAESKSVPLVWASRIDSTKYMNNVQTRTGASERLVAGFRLSPANVNMSTEKGGVIRIVMDGADYVDISYSDFASYMNLNLAGMPFSATKSTILNFKWNASGHPDIPFTAYLLVTSMQGITLEGTVNYTPGTIANLTVTPTEITVPANGGSHVASCSVNTNLEDWMASSNADWLTVTPTTGPTGSTSIYLNVEANYGNTTRTGSIVVEADGYTELVTVSQPAQQGISVGGLVWAPGNLVLNGKEYSFASTQQAYGGYHMSVTDLCNDVKPVGTWRLPTKSEFEALKLLKRTYSTSPAGYWIEGKLFLPSAGYYTDGGVELEVGSRGVYWSSDQYNNEPIKYTLTFGSPDSDSPFDIGYHWDVFREPIRCVKK